MSDVDLSEIINEYFIAGEMTEERYSSSKKTDKEINTVLKLLLPYFAFKAELENKVNNRYFELYNNYNSVLEKDISSRYRRSWLTKLLN